MFALPPVHNSICPLMTDKFPSRKNVNDSTLGLTIEANRQTCLKYKDQTARGIRWRSSGQLRNTIAAATRFKRKLQWNSRNRLREGVLEFSACRRVLFVIPG